MTLLLMGMSFIAGMASGVLLAVFWAGREVVRSRRNFDRWLEKQADAVTKSRRPYES